MKTTKHEGGISSIIFCSKYSDVTLKHSNSNDFDLLIVLC